MTYINITMIFEYKRNCRKCGKEFIHTGKNAAIVKYQCKMADKKESCNHCNRLGKNLNNYKNNGWLGKHCSSEHKIKLSICNKGISTKNRFTNETRRKLRISAIKQHRENGIDFPAVDKGSKEYFENMNLYNGFHIQYPNIEIKKLGYFMDGYDPLLHAVFEYDTKSHLTLKSKEKDLIRQVEIIEFYKNNNKPLNYFFRVNQTGIGEQGMRNILTIEDK